VRDRGRLPGARRGGRAAHAAASRGRRRAGRRGGAAGPGWSCRPGSARPSSWPWQRRLKVAPAAMAAALPQRLRAARGLTQRDTKPGNRFAAEDGPRGHRRPGRRRGRGGELARQPAAVRRGGRGRRGGSQRLRRLPGQARPAVRSTATSWCATWGRRRCSCGASATAPTMAELQATAHQARVVGTYYMLVAADSALRSLPSNLEPRQALFFDGIRYSLDMAGLGIRAPPWDPCSTLDAAHEARDSNDIYPTCISRRMVFGRFCEQIAAAYKASSE
jgi:hypothetical protein